MCGLTGFYSPGARLGTNQLEAMAREMGARIRHRGPDSAGVWCDQMAGIAFAHARLAIVDLSPAGAQPMHSATGQYVMSYNGEIYNHLDIRRELEAAGWSFGWRGHSDTETLLAGFETWGVEQTIRRTIGMFAIALWDQRNRELTLVRDRLGEKPLYYGWQGSGDTAAFLFGSELKSFDPHPSFADAIDRDALALFVRYGYIAAPYSIYQGIRKLLPGSILVLSADNPEPSLTRYWSARDSVARGIADPLDVGDDEAIGTLGNLLGDAVGRQLMSDVPLGGFLSGGVDSSTIVALMQKQSSRPVRTFSIGFDDKNFDEAVHAREVAKHLGTDHTELYLSADDALGVIPLLPAMYDEPFADHSQLPTFLLCQMARRDVTVALSGDAGDELFGGYGRYQSTAALWSKYKQIPLPLRRAARGAIKTLPAHTWSKLGSMGGSRFAGTASSTFGQLVHKGADQLEAPTLAELFAGVSSVWPQNALVIDGHEPRTPMTDNILNVDREPVETLMAIDLQCYLSDDILVKVDRAAMAVSLETRVPMLDHRVVEFAWRLPPRFKVRGGVGKWVLRELLYRQVPRALVDRPKQGFNVPLQHWLRGVLRPWAEALLDAERLRAEGFFDPAPIRAAWEAHLAHKGNYQYALWNVLMFQSWLEQKQQGKRSPGDAPSILSASTELVR